MESDSDSSSADGLRENLVYFRECYSNDRHCDLALYGDGDNDGVKCHGMVVCAAVPGFR